MVAARWQAREVGIPVASASLNWSGPGQGAKRKSTRGAETRLTVTRGRREERSANIIRKPMLYPLSYEGPTCALPSMSGECWSVGLGLAASLPTVCATPMPRAVGKLLTSAPMRGADYTARGWRVESWKSRSDSVAPLDAVALAVVMLRRPGANLVAARRLKGPC
jgi:hypothetical protein